MPKEKTDTIKKETEIEEENKKAKEASSIEMEMEMEMEEQMAEAQAQAAEYLKGWQRERAEFTNYKRRTERERAETYQTAKLDVLGQILPVLDDFDRAIESVPEAIQDTDWVEGTRMIRRKLYNILQNLGIREIEALGQPFDPNVHEAIGQDQSDEYESGHVMDVLQKGYRHGERVLRPAMVRVAQ